MTTLEKVIEVLADISMVYEIRPEMTIDELGLEPIDMWELHGRLEVVFRIRITTDELKSLKTVNDIVNLVESKR